MKTMSTHPLLTTPLVPLVPSPSSRYYAVASNNGDVSFVSSSGHAVDPVSLGSVDHASLGPVDGIRRDDKEDSLFSTNRTGDKVAFIRSVEGGIRVSIFHVDDDNGASLGDSASNSANSHSKRNADSHTPNEVEVDLTRLSLSIVASAVFILQNRLVVRLVDRYGAIFSFVASFSTASFNTALDTNDDDGAMNNGAIEAPAITPTKGTLTPFEPQQSPHPGSIMDAHQVCFPSPTEVVLALDPYLYCVDFSDDLLGGGSDIQGDGNTFNAEGLGSSDGNGSGNAVRVQTWSTAHRLHDPMHPTSLREIISQASVTMGLVERVAEEGTLLPSVGSIALLTHDYVADSALRDYEGGGSEGRVVTLHSDGTIRLWTPNSNGIPSVRRIVLRENNDYVNPPLHPSRWDAHTSILMNGRLINNNDSEEYEVALYVENKIFVFSGSLNGGDVMHTLTVEGRVVDLKWNAEGLLVLTTGEEGERVAFFTRGEGEAVYLPLHHLDDRLTVEEEMERYFVSTKEVMSVQDKDSSKSENAVDKAGLLSLLQPMGRPRPSAIAVLRALTSLDLVDDSVRPEAIGPVQIVSAVRKWKRRDLFRPEETALVVKENNNELIAQQDSIYHLFASAKKQRPSDKIASPSLPGTSAESENKHLMRWITLLSEVRRQESLLNETICLSSVPFNLLVRGTSISGFTIHNPIKTLGPLGNQRDLHMARLDELAMDMLNYCKEMEIQKYCHLDAVLFNVAIKAACLRKDELGNALVCQFESLGCIILNGLGLDERQLEVQRSLLGVDPDFMERWLCPSSKSHLVRDTLGLNTVDMPHYFNVGGENTQVAVALTAARLDSIKQLNMARSLLISSLTSASTASIESGLRVSIFCTALLWCVNQPSHRNKSRTVLEEHFLKEWSVDKSNASILADNFITSIFQYYSGELTASLNNFLSSTNEPRITLRLLAPLVEYPSQSTSTSPSMIVCAAECLLVEASFVAKQCGSKQATHPKALWELASTLLLDIASLDSIDDTNIKETYNALLSRVDVLQRHLQLMENDKTVLSDCCKIALSAIYDTISFITSNLDTVQEMAELTNLWSVAFETCMKGNLWDEALCSCVSSLLKDGQDDTFKRLVLEMVNADAIGKLVDMSMTVVGKVDPEVEEMAEVGEVDVLATPRLDVGFDIFDTATTIIREAAYQQMNATPRTAHEVESMLTNVSNYWGALYTLYASRGDWKQAAQAMDLCGKMASQVAMSAPVNKTTAKMIMDSVSLSLTSCAHAISQISNPSDRYILPHQEGDRFLDREDIDSRATRAVALRALSMDEYAPDSPASILNANSCETINNLARLGYYDHAISVAKSVANVKKSCFQGQNWFDESLKHILSTYLVPAAMEMSQQSMFDGVDKDIQSRSKIAQIRLASSACSVVNPSSQTVNSSTTNSKCFMSNKLCEKSVRSDLAMNLLRQYTTVYSQSVNGLSLHVARSIFLTSGGSFDLPHWLKELCIFGACSDNDIECGLFASKNRGQQVADPAGLVRLCMEYHKYYDACEVFVTVLSKKNNQLSNTFASPSNRLPEKGNIDYVPYDLIDLLWQAIEDIYSSTPCQSNGLSALKAMQKRLERALLEHFKLLKLSEEGLRSARALAISQ